MPISTGSGIRPYGGGRVTGRGQAGSSNFFGRSVPSGQGQMSDELKKFYSQKRRTRGSPSFSPSQSIFLNRGGGMQGQQPSYGYSSGGGGNTDWMQEAERAVAEAKQKSEASKGSALSYWDAARGFGQQMGGQLTGVRDASLGYFNPIQQDLAGIQGDLIGEDEERALIAERRGKLGAYGQNLAGMFADPQSGMQGRQRLDIARGIASEQANLPIETRLEIARANRAARLALASTQAGVAGQMAGVQRGYASDIMGQMAHERAVASGKAGVQMAYQYDPGAGYYQQLAEAMGRAPSSGFGGGSGGGGYTTGRGGSGSTSSPYAPTTIKGGARSGGFRRTGTLFRGDGSGFTGGLSYQRKRKTGGFRKY